MSVSFNAFIAAAQDLSVAAKKYQETDAGKEQFKLRYELRDLFINYPDRATIEKTLMDMGADLNIRVSKWNKKMAVGQFTADPERKASLEALLSKAEEYVKLYNSPDHQKALAASDAKEQTLAFQKEVVFLFKQEIPTTNLLTVLEGKGFKTTNAGDERVFGRLKNWDKQWRAGNFDYFDVK